MNDFELPETLIKSKEFVVEEKDTAVHLQSGSVAVLSTPTMILFMEQAARFALEDILSDDLSSVGTEVCIKHRKAVGVGETVKAVAEMISNDGRKVNFEVKVLHNDVLIGDGTHTRFIIDKKRFMKSLSDN